MTISNISSINNWTSADSKAIWESSVFAPHTYDKNWNSTREDNSKWLNTIKSEKGNIEKKSENPKWEEEYLKIKNVNNIIPGISSDTYIRIKSGLNL